MNMQTLTIQIAQALAYKVSPTGYWFVDDPDDFRELDGEIQPGEAIVVDEIKLADTKPNEIKKLYDVEKARRIRCRHLNGQIPEHCPRIFVTNSKKSSFYPDMEAGDETGVMRRQIFATVTRNLRAGAGSTQRRSAQAILSVSEDPGLWKVELGSLLDKSSLSQYLDVAIRACEELGVDFAQEVVDNGAAIADQCDMKPLQRRRFLAVLPTLQSSKPLPIRRHNIACMDDSNDEANNEEPEEDDE
jgi:hypothetical protein